MPVFLADQRNYITYVQTCCWPIK